MGDTKVCRKCNLEHSVEGFFVIYIKKDGTKCYRKVCKKCTSERQKEYYLREAEKIKQQNREYYLRDAEKIRQKNKEYYLREAEKIKQKNKEYYLREAEKIRQKNKEYYLRDVEKIRQRQIEYKSREDVKKRRKERLEKDMLYAFKTRLRANISNAFNRRGHKKFGIRTQEIVGIDFEGFKAYIESKFQDGMTWENRGKWHLDHIIPISLAETEEDVIRLCHYTNYQPLWAIDNIRKGNKIIKSE